MKIGLPADHGLSKTTLSINELMPDDGVLPLLTDVQYEALGAGVARGNSLLVSAPTSTGKTLIGWWAVASAIESGLRAVYLVSHRALAKQKFEEAQRIFCDGYLNGFKSELVCATGDGVEDANGLKTNTPLSATILVATYEKFLGCLSVGGPPQDLASTCFICDEIQLVGEKNRGQNAELLLTLMRRAGWAQLVGLSAVMSEPDATSLAAWLEIGLVRNPKREKSLRIECRTPSATYSVSAGPGFEGEEQVQYINSSELSTTVIVSQLLKETGRSPVIVFCMKVDDTYEHARSWVAQTRPSLLVEPPPGLDVEPELLSALQRRAAYHNAELTEDERYFVEERVAAGEVDVVYATSTLAAGVNFPLGSAVFSSWTRYNFDRKTYDPIGRAEFQNMAGRVGRMGQHSSDGLVVLTAVGNQAVVQARDLINLGSQEALGQGINRDDFGSLTLQLFAGKLCKSKIDAFDLVSSTLTASRERARNIAGIEHWRFDLDNHIDRLIKLGCLIETRGEISVTSFGLAVANSGLKPETAVFFFDGLKRSGQSLVSMLAMAHSHNSENDLLFVLANAALCSPEFDATGGRANRLLNWRIGRNGPVPNAYARRLNDYLFERPWNANAAAANGALQVAEWAAGQPRDFVEKLVSGVRLGTIQSTARDIAWILTGVSEIIARTTSANLADESKPEALRGTGPEVESVRQLARSLRRQAERIAFGLPTDVLWMTELNLKGARTRLTRQQILSLRSHGLIRPIDLMDGGPIADEKRKRALAVGNRVGPTNQVRNAAMLWKIESRDHYKKIHLRRAAKNFLLEHVSELYELKGDALELAFEKTLSALSISFQKLDEKGKQAHPDYLITIEDYPSIVVEIKSKQNPTDLVSLNIAMDVLGASELIGLKENFCVTLCSPGVEPSVPATIESCGRLSVLEITDFVEAMLRLKEGSLTRAGLQNWLTTPGIALAETLPHPD